MIVRNPPPLLACARIGALDLLQTMVGHMLIPDAVWREVTPAGNRLGAEEITASELLLDERAARAIATARGVNIIGTAGLLARAKQRGFVTAVRPFLEHMPVEGFRYSRRFVEGFLKELGE